MLIPEVSMTIARNLKTWDICGIVLRDKTTDFKVAFYISVNATVTTKTKIHVMVSLKHLIEIL